MMKLEAVITCVDYADFLACTLPTNRGQFDRLVVATAPEDDDTARLCEYWNVQCVRTDAFRSRWGEFRKAAGINAGLQALDRDGWVLHLDADVLLPPLTRSHLEQANLDPGFIYGADRQIVPGATALAEHLFSPALQHENDIYVHLDAFALSPRIATSKQGGYLPIGYFQLWHPARSGIASYAEDPASNGNRTDMLFAAQWPRERRALIPELVVYHLESEPAVQGANWDGRTTAPFGCHPHHRRRRHHHHHHHDYGE